MFVGLFFLTVSFAGTKPKIAVFSGPRATILNSEPLITSNKARSEHGLPLLKNPDGTALRYDHLVPQQLAAPVEVFIEQFSAHPLEKDAADLYGPPDGFIDKNGVFHTDRQGPDDKPVYKAVLRPEDGLYLLPYMAVQADGKPWNDDCAFRRAPAQKCRQPFYPDASRIFEEIDRSIAGRNDKGIGNMLAAMADFDFYRAVPSAGYKKGLKNSERTDEGAGDIQPEVAGKDFFYYRPYHMITATRVQDLARASNTVQKALDSGVYTGAIWLESSPTVEETIYWLNLLVDTTVPIVGNAAQRVHGALSADGDRNIVDSVSYVTSGTWSGRDGKDELGAVLIQDERIHAARQVQKEDARPGGYRATGGHGGILGTIGDPGPVTIWFKPTTLHTWKSAVNLNQLPSTVQGVLRIDGNLTNVEVKVKTPEGFLNADAVPKVTILKAAAYMQDTAAENPDNEADIMARIEKNLKDFPLAGFVAEGEAPYAAVTKAMQRAIEIAALSGLPTVRVGRGDAGGLTKPNPFDLTIEGSNLTASKARLLLKAAILKFGSLPLAMDPRKPTFPERKAVQEKIKQYQKLFLTH
jgi:hypothetical protein